jgi:hypothetical protein
MDNQIFSSFELQLMHKYRTTIPWHSRIWYTHIPLNTTYHANNSITWPTHWSAFESYGSALCIAQSFCAHIQSLTCTMFEQGSLHYPKITLVCSHCVNENHIAVSQATFTHRLTKIEIINAWFQDSAVSLFWDFTQLGLAFSDISTIINIFPWTFYVSDQ